MTSLNPVSYRELLVVELLDRPTNADAAQDICRPLLASMLVGRRLGEGVLHAGLGLPQAMLDALWATYFPGPRWALASGKAAPIPEEDDLVQLLLDHRAGHSEAEAWIARIVAHACSGRDHLWQDLGLANRAELSALMNAAFPSLAALNNGDMKWKKFIYRHYCERDGIYVCPVPSCGVCADYARCFAPED